MKSAQMRTFLFNFHLNFIHIFGDFSKKFEIHDEFNPLIIGTSQKTWVFGYIPDPSLTTTGAMKLFPFKPHPQTVQFIAELF